MKGHFEILTSSDRLHRISQAEDEVCHHESVKSPLVSEDSDERLPVLTRPFAVDGVVCTHHAVRAGVNDGSEVGQVALVQCRVVYPGRRQSSVLLPSS